MIQKRRVFFERLKNYKGKTYYKVWNGHTRKNSLDQGRIHLENYTERKWVVSSYNGPGTLVMFRREFKYLKDAKACAKEKWGN